MNVKKLYLHSGSRDPGKNLMEIQMNNVENGVSSLKNKTIIC